MNEMLEKPIFRFLPLVISRRLLIAGEDQTPISQGEAMVLVKYCTDLSLLELIEFRRIAGGCERFVNYEIRKRLTTN